MAAQYHIFMSRKVGNSWEQPKDIEASFRDVRYIKCEGLNNVGEPRIYTEEYADAEDIRVFLPDNPTRKTTEIKLELAFIGEVRQISFQNFVDYITHRRLRYWDDMRKRQAEMYLSGAAEVSEEKFYGGKPYFIARFTFTCVDGITHIKDQIQTTN